MRSAGASSPSSAERPANVLARSSGVGESAIPFSSAEQPATSSDPKITCIRDVQRWLASEAIARYSTADLESIREAAAALSTPKPKQEDVRPFMGRWQLGPNVHSASPVTSVEICYPSGIRRNTSCTSEACILNTSRLCLGCAHPRTARLAIVAPWALQRHW